MMAVVQRGTDIIGFKKGVPVIIILLKYSI